MAKALGCPAWESGFKSAEQLLHAKSWRLGLHAVHPLQYRINTGLALGNAFNGLACSSAALQLTNWFDRFPLPLVFLRVLSCDEDSAIEKTKKNRTSSIEKISISYGRGTIRMHDSSLSWKQKYAQCTIFSLHKQVEMQFEGSGVNPLLSHLLTSISFLVYCIHNPLLPCIVIFPLFGESTMYCMFY